MKDKFMSYMILSEVVSEGQNRFLLINLLYSVVGSLFIIMYGCRSDPYNFICRGSCGMSVSVPFCSKFGSNRIHDRNTAQEEEHLC